MNCPVGFIRTSLLGLMLLSSSGHGEAVQRVSLWFYEMMAADVRSCTAIGPEWRQRMLDMLPLAKSNTAGFLPATLWDSLARIALADEPAATHAEGARRCEELVKTLSSPTAKGYFRGSLVKGVASGQTYRCMLWFPDLAEAMRKGWTDAFKRNGLPLDDDEIEDGLAEWRARGVRQEPVTDNQVPGCRKLITFLSGPEFDKAFSEEWAKQQIDCSVSGAVCAEDK